MTLRKKIENQLKIACKGVDLTKVSNIEFYVKQDNFFRCYTPIIVSATEMAVIIPFEDAKQLKMGRVRLQFAFVNENGIPDASNIVVRHVQDFLKEAGYDPNRRNE